MKPGDFKKSRIGVLMGGLSKEREISLRTGRAVLTALRARDYDAFEIDCTRNLADQLSDRSIGVAFICLHGPYGEDGAVQGLLEWIQIPYTGSSVLASALGMDKMILNPIARDLGVRLPQEWYLDTAREGVETFVEELPDSYPVVVKPSREGSTINVGIVRKRGDLVPAIQNAMESDTKILVEEYIVGREVTLSIVNGRIFPIIEIIPKSGFYDYTAKYTKGMTEYICPASVSQKAEEFLRTWSLKLYHFLDCNGPVRFDYILKTSEGETPYFLELNTIPGMTETSLVPKAAAAAGIAFEELVEEILSSAKLHLKS